MENIGNIGGLNNSFLFLACFNTNLSFYLDYSNYYSHLGYYLQNVSANITSDFLQVRPVILRNHNGTCTEFQP